MSLSPRLQGHDLTAVRMRAVINFDSEPEPRWFLLRAPHRLVIDLPPHCCGFTNNRFIKVRRLGGRTVHDNRQRRFERMGKVACMTPRFFGLFFIMIKQTVKLAHHRHNLIWQSLGNPVLLATAHLCN